MITAEQVELRRGLISGTVMSAICGVNPWMTPHDAFLELTGQLADGKRNDATEAGNFLEGSVLTWLEFTTGATLTHRDMFVRTGDSIFCGNLDGATWGPWGSIGEPFLAEGKTTGIVGPADDEYGEDGSDDVPKRVWVQTHHYFGVIDEMFPDRAQLRLALVPVLIGGKGYRLYRLRRDDALVEAIRGRGQKFWDQYVVPNIAPLGSMPTLGALKRRKRTAAKTVELADEVVDAYIVANAALKQAKADAEVAEIALKTSLGDAEAGTFAGGEKIVTYFETKRGGYTVAPTVYRSIQVKENKKGKR